MRIIRLVFPILFFLSIARLSYSQQHQVDSLANVLKTAKEDSNKVKTLNELSREIILAGNYLKADSLSRLAIQISEKINYGKGEAIAYLNIGKIGRNKGNYLDALTNYREALKIYEELGNKKGMDQIYRNIGVVYEEQGNYPDALKEYLQALKIDEDIGSKGGIAQASLNIGSIYYFQNNAEEALKYYKQGLSLYRELKDNQGISDAYSEMGGFYWQQHEYPQALEFMLQYLKLAQQSDDKENLGYAYANVGVVYEAMNNFDEAMKSFLQAMKIAEQVGDKEGVAGSYVNIGDNLTKQKKYTEAKEWLNKGLKIAKGIGSKDIIKIEYSNLAKVDSLTGNYKAAYLEYRMYIAYRDSLKNEQNTKKIISEQMTYEFSRKEDSIKAVQEKRETLMQTAEDKKEQKQKLFRDALSVGLVFALLFALVFFLQRQRITREKKRSDELLLNILPSETAEELKLTGKTKAKNYETVTVMFTDFVNFTKTIENLNAEELVNSIHHYYSEIDTIIARHGIEKIKTIGDGYMAAGGLPIPNETNPVDVVKATIEIREFIEQQKSIRQREGKIVFDVRIGVHTGSVIAGIVGIKKFAYDIWGDTVNTAARMEQHSEAGKINISGSTYLLVKDKFKCVHRGKVHAKNKGEIDMYFVERENAEDTDKS